MQGRRYSKFSSILDYSSYDPLPNNWLIGMTDVIDSSAAVKRGEYQNVNYVGVSVIAALANALESYDFPFSFAGDGAVFAVPEEAETHAIDALQTVVAMAEAEFGLTLRAALMRVGEIRENGHDVRVARYAASHKATFSMFAGGGLRWAEAEMKSGRFSVDIPETVAKPDLTGLACEWAPIQNRNGLILSLLVEPKSLDENRQFSELAREILTIFEVDPREGHPLPETLPPARKNGGSYDVKRWLEVGVNSDFRKYDDVLRLTIDCSEQQAAVLEKILCAAAKKGEIRYGMHKQSHVLLTCFVPSLEPASHLHFLDGMDGGYARASEKMKAWPEAA
jgi:hypothetical protein